VFNWQHVQDISFASTRRTALWVGYFYSVGKADGTERWSHCFTTDLDISNFCAFVFVPCNRIFVLLSLFLLIEFLYFCFCSFWSNFCTFVFVPSDRIFVLLSLFLLIEFL
jgi:hypothetical protein